jgi:N-acyl-D-amino-acid deacylase
MFDIVIRNGTLIDGSGAKSRTADLAVIGDRIAAIGSIEGRGRQEIDARGLTVAPGFIDIHSHSDYTLLVDPRAVSSISQGVTCEVIGNCGFGCAPIADAMIARGSIYGFDGSVELGWRTTAGYLERLEQAHPAVNVVALVPNGQLRRSVLGVSDDAASVGQLDEMCGLLEAGLDAGAFGYSTGLEYAAESGAPPEEIERLCRVVARRGRLYATHTRNRDEGALGAIDEALDAARHTGVRLQLSHLLPRKTDDHQLERGIEAVERAVRDGVSVYFDMHTRLFGFTFLSTLLPAWALVNGKSELRRHLTDSTSRARMKQYRSIVNGAGWDRVTLMASPSSSAWAGRTIAQLAAEQKTSPHDFCLDLLLSEIDTLDRTMVIIQSYKESSQAAVFQHPLCMPGSDATALAPDGPLKGQTFHGAYSWASWFYRFMVRDRRLLTAEAAVHRLTGLPAKVLGLTDVGSLAAGLRADVAIFDAAAFGERATLAAPNVLARGMQHVIVGGKVTLLDGASTGVRNGRVFRA